MDIDISVIMSVYNTKEEWLRKAIESILNQTYSNFEFIIVIDCPTDNSLSVVESYANKDKRIRIIRNETNIGLTKSLNKALSICKGKYIARMDSDDISFPKRFEKQVRLLSRNNSIVAVGCRCYCKNSAVPVQYECSKDQDVLKTRLLFRNAGIPHPTAMIKKDILDKYNIKYDERIQKSQDYKLWVDLIKYGKLIIVPEVLFEYRVHSNQITSNPSSQLSYAHIVAVEQAENLIGKLSEVEKYIHCHFLEIDNFKYNRKEQKRYLKRLIEANKKKKIYDLKIFNKELKYMWAQKAFRQLCIHKRLSLFFDIWTFENMFPARLMYIFKRRQEKKEYESSIRAYKRSVKNERS